MDVIVENRKLSLTPQMLWGSGGEADVYELNKSYVLKYFKPPNHPDHMTQADRDAARRRIAEHQTKLAQFPRNLPSNVVAPHRLALNTSGKIVGYTMPFISGAEQLMKYSEKQFRKAGVANMTVQEIFQKLHPTIVSVHGQQVVIGDFNDLNVLIQGTDPFLIDTDSFQFAPYKCSVYTVSFVDPMLCDPKQSNPMLVQPHNEDSDWYAFMVMLMKSLLYVGPYGGVYRPKDHTKRIPEPTRPLHRVTVFDPEVRYPRPATHYKVLPDELLEEFHRVFVKDQRGEFPLKILEAMRWTTCSKCGIEHARNLCPECSEVAPAAVKEKITMRGKVTARRIFRTKGVILFAALQNDKLLWLYNESGVYLREDGKEVLRRPPDPRLRYRLKGSDTYMGMNGQLLTVVDGKVQDRSITGRFGNLPIFDANSKHLYWLEQGRLVKDGVLGRDYIGDILPNQTLFWVGDTFGFGFYKASKLQIAFLFDAERRGINDSVKLPAIRGQLLDSTCFFAGKRCWFLTTTEESSRRVNRCYVINRDGSVEAQAEVDQGDDSWLGVLRGKLAASNFLLAATDDGIVRVEMDGGSITVVQTFPDTAPFVDAESHIFPSKGGIYVVSSNEVTLINIA